MVTKTQFRPLDFFHNRVVFEPCEASIKYSVVGHEVDGKSDGAFYSIQKTCMTLPDMIDFNEIFAKTIFSGKLMHQ